MLDDMLIMKNRGFIPIRSTIFLLLYKAGPSSLLFTGYQGLGSRLFFKEIKRPGRTASLHLVPKLRMSRSLIHSRICLHVVRRVTFTFTIFLFMK